MKIIKEAFPNTAYVRYVSIVANENGEFVSNAWSIHRKTKESYHRGCAVHPGYEDHIERANNWVNREEEYFF